MSSPPLDVQRRPLRRPANTHPIPFEARRLRFGSPPADHPRRLSTALLLLLLRLADRSLSATQTHLNIELSLNRRRPTRPTSSPNLRTVNLLKPPGRLQLLSQSRSSTNLFRLSHHTFNLSRKSSSTNQRPRRQLTSPPRLRPSSTSTSKPAARRRNAVRYGKDSSRSSKSSGTSRRPRVERRRASFALV